MKIQKYRAKIMGTQTEVIGYITEIREQTGEGSYGNGTDFLISVTEISMPNGKYGTFKVEKESIEAIHVDCQHPYALVHTTCMGEINKCMKCGNEL